MSLISSRKFSELQKENDISLFPVQQTFHTVNGENMNVFGRVQLTIKLSLISFVVQFIVCDIDRV